MTISVRVVSSDGIHLGYGVGGLAVFQKISKCHLGMQWQTPQVPEKLCSSFLERLLAPYSTQMASDGTGTILYDMQRLSSRFTCQYPLFKSKAVKCLAFPNKHKMSSFNGNGNDTGFTIFTCF